MSHPLDALPQPSDLDRVVAAALDHARTLSRDSVAAHRAGRGQVSDNLAVQAKRIRQAVAAVRSQA